MIEYWHWLVVGTVLVALEMLIPGIFLLWLGVAALVLGTLLWILPAVSLTLQIVLYAALAILAIIFAKRYQNKLYKNPSDQPHLNERGADLIGQEFILLEPIVNGTGRIKIGATWWSARGEDAPAGAKVRVVKLESALVFVEKL
jgi:inner membrane protein